MPSKVVPIKTLHMVGNAHIDPVWLWRWPEGFQEALATFRSALDRMNEYPDFMFTSSSAALYEWVEAVDPGMISEIRRRVAEGRWVLAGGWWLQPDCNIPGGESFVRQGLYGQRYFQRTFGTMASVGYNPDSFGHNAVLPQILRKSGMDAYVFMRPDPREAPEVPGPLFWWEAPDGSRVLAFRIIGAYGTWRGDLEDHIRLCAAAFPPGVDDLMCFYGVGDHGGGPTRANLDSILALQDDPDLPDLAFSSPDAFYQTVRDTVDLPVWRGELQHHASGCYAAHSRIKRDNRRAENALMAAEKLASIAARVTGLPYPDDLGRAWKGVLFNQFHDILAGTSLREAYDDARDLHGEAVAIADRAANNALQSIAWNIRLPFPGEDGQNLVLFNPHAWPVRTCVPWDRDVWRDTEQNRHRTFRVTDEEGQEVPSQAIAPHGLTTFRTRQAFLADLPPMGYRVYRVEPALSPSAAPALAAGETFLENEHARLEVDPASGHIARLILKEMSADILVGEAARAAVIADTSDTWSHGVLRFDEEAGAFTVRSVRLVEHGPVLASLRVESGFADSTLVQTFTVYAGLPWVRVDVLVDWRERFQLLKLRFPTALHEATATYEIPYGHLERPSDGEEEPMQAWMDLTGRTDVGAAAGLSILNDGKYSASIEGGTLSLTVLRSPIYAHHDPFVPEEGGDYAFIDQGEQRFTYVLLPHAGDWREAGTVRRAAELNQPAAMVPGTVHPGRLPLRGSFVACDAENVVVSVVKWAEDGEDILVRAYETAGRSARATFDLSAWGRTIAADFAPGEIKTFRFPSTGDGPVVETDLLERPT